MEGVYYYRKGEDSISWVIRGINVVILTNWLEIDKFANFLETSIPLQRGPFLIFCDYVLQCIPPLSGKVFEQSSFCGILANPITKEIYQTYLIDIWSQRVIANDLDSNTIDLNLIFNETIYFINRGLIYPLANGEFGYNINLITPGLLGNSTNYVDAVVFHDVGETLRFIDLLTNLTMLSTYYHNNGMCLDFWQIRSVWQSLIYIHSYFTMFDIQMYILDNGLFYLVISTIIGICFTYIIFG